MNALRRVLSAPGMVFALWALQLAVAWQLGDAVRVAAAAAMRGYARIDDGHLLGAVMELMATSPAIAGVMVQAAITSTLVGIVFWALAYGGVIKRLQGPASPSQMAAASVGFLPGVVVQTIYVGALRAIPIGLCALLAAKAPVVAVGLGLVVTAVTVVAADLARVEVVLHGGRAFHPMTALRALKTAHTDLRLLSSAGAIAIAQVFVPAILIYLVLSDTAGAGSIWLARCLALGGLVLGLWRIALAVDARARRA